MFSCKPIFDTIHLNIHLNKVKVMPFNKKLLYLNFVWLNLLTVYKESCLVFLTWTTALLPITSRTCPLLFVPSGRVRWTISAYLGNWIKDRIYQQHLLDIIITKLHLQEQLLTYVWFIILAMWSYSIALHTPP